MKEGWEYKKIGEVCETASGGTPSKSHAEYYKGGTIPWLRSGEVSQGYIYDSELYITEVGMKNSSAKLFPINTVVIAMYGATVGQVGLLKREMTTNQAICGIFPNKFLYPTFLMFSLKAKKSIFLKDAVGGAQPNISQNIVKNTSIPIPTLEEQQQIVSELDLLSGVIEKQKAQLEELDKLAQSIFYDMFGDPVKNEKGWENKKVGEIATFYNGKAHEKVIDDNGDYILVNAKFIASKGKVIKRTNHQLFPLYKNDIVMVMSDVPHGKALASCYLIEKDNQYSLNQRICAFRKYKANPVFLFNVLNRNSYYLRFDDGNGQTNMRKNEVTNCPIPLPPLSLQQEFAAKVEAIEAMKAKVRQSLKEAETLFNSRMDYYFN